MEFSEIQKALRRKLQSTKKAPSKESILGPSKPRSLLPVISEKTEPKTPDEDKEISELQRLLEQLKTKMREFRQQEMSRISKEFIENAYGKKFGISQRDIIAAMIGEEDLRYEWERQLKEREEYIKHKMGSSTFSFGAKGYTQRASTSMKHHY